MKLESTYNTAETPKDQEVAFLSRDNLRVKASMGTLKVWDDRADQAVSLNYGDWSRWYPTVYPLTYNYYQVAEKSDFEKAFKIVKSLMEKGHIKELTVPEFAELVEDVAKSLK